MGTVYNYFSSKEELLAAYLFSDWNQSLEAMSATARDTQDPRPVLECAYREVMAFGLHHMPVFGSEESIRQFRSHKANYQKLLRQQVQEILRPLCRDDFHAEFVAEAFLTWTMEGKDFEAQWDLLGRLF